MAGNADHTGSRSYQETKDGARLQPRLRLGDLNVAPVQHGMRSALYMRNGGDRTGRVASNGIAMVMVFFSGESSDNVQTPGKDTAR